MKIKFDDKSYIMIQESSNSDKITIIISATDSNNQLKKITNAVEITRDEFKLLISDIKIS